MPIQRDYTCVIGGRPRRHRCEEGSQLPYDDPVRIQVYIRRYPHDEPESTGATLSNVVSHSRLVSEDTAVDTLTPHLSTLGIPTNIQTPMIRGISNYSRRLAAINETCRVCGRVVLPEIISLVLADETEVVNFMGQYLSIIFLEEIEADILAIAALMSAGEVRPVPATKSSIESLEKVVYNDDDGSSSSSSSSFDQCSICLEEFVGGSEVTRMPCAHVYHGNCIVKWLETGNLCPLCRYRMPS